MWRKQNLASANWGNRVFFRDKKASILNKTPLDTFLCILLFFGIIIIMGTMFQDCWASHNRTSDGQLQPDPDRFPHGMTSLAEYVSL